MTKKIFTYIVGCLALSSLHAQSFDVEDIKNLFGKGNLLKLNGGFSLNSILYEGNEGGNRDPFTYYFNGNINLNICNLVNMPFSFALTNSGSSYQLPSSPNRLSLHPTYRWITAHIGDVSMSFSPYTLNGHLFTGVGVDLRPGSDWEFSVMYGRFQKAVEYDEIHPALLPTYKRMGYGGKIGWKREKAGVSFNFFTAKDNINSLECEPDTLGVNPMQNLAGSLTVFLRPVKFLELNAEYGLSLLTTDLRAPKEDRSGTLAVWPASRMSSAFYKAVKLSLDYVIDKSRIGVGYERIDPGYRTLGAYYFTNDLENITLNASQTVWQNKMNISASLGYQHDNLAKTKARNTNRMVGSLSVNATFSERVSANASYSNFQTYSNLRSNFETVNQLNTMDKIDTMNYVQLSQTAMLTMNFVTKKTDTQLHNLNFNLTYQDAADKEGDRYRPGSISELINASSMYNWSFLQSGLALTASINCSSSKVRNENIFTWGPTLGVSAKAFKKKVGISGSLSYNTSELQSVKQMDIYLCRFTAAYSPFKRHNITLGYNYQWRDLIERESSYNSIGTIGYTYSF